MKRLSIAAVGLALGGALLLAACEPEQPSSELLEYAADMQAVLEEATIFPDPWPRGVEQVERLARIRPPDSMREAHQGLYHAAWSSVLADEVVLSIQPADVVSCDSRSLQPYDFERACEMRRQVQSTFHYVEVVWTERFAEACDIDSWPPGFPMNDIEECLQK